MPTIKDIAREAGVSHGTVSNVINGRGNVSVEKIQLVRCFCRALRTAAGRPCMRYSRTSLSSTATQFSYIPPALWRPPRKNCWLPLWLSGSARSSAVRACWMPQRIIGQRPRSFQLYSFLGKAVHSKMLCMPRSIPSEWEQTSPGICGGKDCGGSVFLQSLPHFRIPRCF